MKKLSIIIPVYNVGRLIEKCLNSILLDNSDDYDIILVDDGSTDDSGVICDEYSKKYDNIISYHKPNGGASDARNYGVSKCTSEYIWFVDSDDYIENGAISKFIGIIDSCSPDIIVCQSKVIKKDGTIVDECNYSIKEGNYSSKEFMEQLKNNKDSVIFAPQYYLIKKSLIDKNNLSFHKGIIHEDEIWIPTLLILANSIYYSNMNIYYHYMWDGSVMHSTKIEKSGISCLTVTKEMLKVFENSKRNDLEFLRDHNANIFLQAVWKIPNFLKDKNNIMRSMPLKNAYYFKTRIKSILYFISPRIYIFIHNFFSVK